MSDADRDATPAQPAPAATPKPFDLEFRPDSYLIPDSPVEFAVMRLRGWLRRNEVRALMAAGDIDGADRLRSVAERTPDRLPPWKERQIPDMVGEYLPALAADEVELFRITRGVPFQDVTSVRACPERGGWTVRVLDEQGNDYRTPQSWYSRPLALKECIEFVEAAECESRQPGLVFGTLEALWHAKPGKATRKRMQLLRRLHRFESGFYPELVRWFEQGVESWCEEQWAFERLGAEERRELRAFQREERSAARGVAVAKPRKPRRAASAPPVAKPDESDPWVQYQRAMERVLLAGEDMEARARFAGLRAGQKEPGGRAWAGWIFGMIAERAGRFDMAAEFYQRGRVDGTTDVDVDYWLHNNAGYSLVKLGLHAEAEALCRHATRTVPGRYNAWKNLGLALAGQGRAVDAARAYLTAIRACPSERRAASHLCELFPEHADLLEREVPELVAPIAEWRRWRLKAADPGRGTAARTDAPQQG